MRLGIISDIHGNYPALERVLSELHSAGCQEVICLGDVSGYYSMVNECIDRLRSENIVCLKGNHDSYLLGEGQCPRSNSVNRCISFQREIVTEENLAWLSTLQPMRETALYCAVHGGWRDPLDEYIEQLDFDLARKIMPDTKIFLSGHSHIQRLQENGNLIYCNPGSVGQPRDYDSRAAYAILENGKIQLFRTEYDIDKIAAHMKAFGFTDYFYKNLYFGKKIGEQ